MIGGRVAGVGTVVQVPAPETEGILQVKKGVSWAW